MAKIRILVVDDQDAVRESLAHLLRTYSSFEEIMEASDGEEAIRVSRELNPDVILMDINMPRMNGIEATKVISSELPQIRIIGLSIYDDRNTVNAMLNAGATAYLIKGCSTNLLFSTIRGNILFGDDKIEDLNRG